MTAKAQINWKEQYKGTWKAATKRHEFVQKFIESTCGVKLTEVGFGTKSSAYISGSSSRNGYEKGEPDFRVVGTDLFLQITGSGSGVYTLDSDLLVRPDKVDNARRHLYHRDTCVVYYLEKLGSLRAIHLDQRFFERVDNGELKVEKRQMRDVMETYLVIPANNPVVRPIGDFTRYVQSLKQHVPQSGL